MKKTRILLVDDDPKVLDFLSGHLNDAGYKVFTATSGKIGLHYAKKVVPDIIILDVIMPEMDGIETCKELRLLPELKDTLIIFYTARTENYSQIAGLDAGADDYITKPVNPRVLTSRIQAILRRKIHHDGATGVVNVGDEVNINNDGYTITVGEEEFILPKKEFELLSLLASKPGKVFNRKDILHKIWGEDVQVGNRSIDVHIRKLRKKLGGDKIKTLRGVGYKFET
ncbi:MAG TPA: response regulator transcription factor [Bacteroidia bacterium]|jgi:two-component system alkaline phosphatase synthesis response regulator PhoP|nr:response regulator transcription factor [Bacteroidia bacterium]